MSKFEIVAFIFARGGSKGLKNKNLRQLMCEKTLGGKNGGEK